GWGLIRRTDLTFRTSRQSDFYGVNKRTVTMNAQTNSISAWPNSSHIAVVFNVAYEAWSDGKGPAIGPVGNPLPSGAVDSNAVSGGNYGEIVGINRLLAILKRSGVQANVMVSGILAERHPDIVRRIYADGHDIMANSFAQ